jgi:uncharacterized protein (TIGR02246 family)
MYSQTNKPRTPGSGAETLISALYHQLLDSWNRRDAGDFAALFVEDGFIVGFDGSQMNGKAEIEAELRRIFADHVTATYVSKIKGVSFLTPEVGILHAVAGLVPPMKADINPATNAIQTLVAVQQDGPWRIALYQNTPAQFHGRPELSEALTEELRQLL